MTIDWDMGLSPGDGAKGQVRSFVALSRVRVKPESPHCGNAAKPSLQHIAHAAQHGMLQRAAAVHKALPFQAVLRVS
jgi:hypothetical protein